MRKAHYDRMFDFVQIPMRSVTKHVWNFDLKIIAFVTKYTGLLDLAKETELMDLSV